MKVAVVGAGPGGAFCAERLARAGHAVDIFDPTHPREKPCGGGVTPETFAHHPELREILGAGKAVHQIRLVAGARGEALAVKIRRPIVVYARATLDGLLLERAKKAGARHLALRVRGARIEATHAALDVAGEERHYDFIVGADGTSSTIRRALVGRRPGSAMSYAGGGFYVEGIREEDLFIEFIPEYAGYFWVFPRGEHASVGLVAPVGKENAREISQRVLEIMARRYPDSLALPRTPYAASIPVAALDEASAPVLGGPRFGLVGDAANLTDPITGEGIQHAIDSGALLAEVLEEAGPEEAADLYARRWMDGTGRDLLTCARIARYLYRPSTVKLTLQMCRRSTRLRALLVDCLMVVQPYSGMWQRVLADFTPFGDESARRSIER